MVVGLGNPGTEYAATRHNIGAMTADRIGVRVGGRYAANRRCRAGVLEARIAGSRVVLAKPTSFMNESGGPVAALLGYFGIDFDHLVVVHDELDLPFGQPRLKFGGGDNGHNGLKSIRKSLGTGEYYRVRLGIGRPHGAGDAADFVLRAFSVTERNELAQVIDRGADAVESLIDLGLERSQERFNAGIE